MEQQQTVKYALMGLGAVCVAGLAFWLSKDDVTPLDYKKFDKIHLQALMEELELELTCIYARNYNVFLKVKEQMIKEGQDPAETLTQLRAMVNGEIKDKQEQVLDDYCFCCHPSACKAVLGDKDLCKGKQGITFQQFELWLEHFENEDFMVKQATAMQKLDDDLFKRQRIEHLSFEDEIPVELTAEKYLLMYKKIWAVIRHDLYKDILARRKELRVQELPPAEFNTLYENTHRRFEQVRQDVYCLIMGEDEIEQSQARQYMQKAYCCYATISSSAKSSDVDVQAAKWPNLVQQVAQEHGKLINDLAQGKFYANIEVDPRESTLADEKLDLKSLSAYKGNLSKQKTTISDDKVLVKAVSKKADKYVDKMIALAQAAKKRVADKKAAAAQATTDEKTS